MLRGSSSPHATYGVLRQRRQRRADYLCHLQWLQRTTPVAEPHPSPFYTSSLTSPTITTGCACTARSVTSRRLIGGKARAERDRKLEEARQQRQLRRLEASQEFLAVTPGDEGRSAGVRIRLNRPGETEVGQAGEPPGGGIIRWAPRVEEVGSARFRSSEIHAPVPHPVPWTSSNERPLCLENSRRAATELRRCEKSSAFHFRLNQDSFERHWQAAWGATCRCVLGASGCVRLCRNPH